jgi:hypothetical protein
MSHVAHSDRFALHRLHFVALALGVSTAVGCGTPAASVIIDNTSPSSMVVKVDGQQAAKIEGHTFQTLRLMPGSYEMEVEVGGRRVFKASRVIEESDTFLAGKMYLFNPTSSARYAVCKVVYGGSLLTDATENAFIKLAENYKGEKVDETKLQYYRIKKCAEPMPGSSWFELPGGISYILRDAPDSVYTRSPETTRRVLTRISKEEYHQLRQAHRVENPTQQDVYALAEVTERVLDSMSELEPWD